MGSLVVAPGRMQGAPTPEYEMVVEKLRGYPAIQAGLWLYVDDLERSHRVSQAIESPIGAYWHSIMHRREGDFSNARYWLRQAHRLQLTVDSAALVDSVAADSGRNSPELVHLQRREWRELMELSA